MTRIKTKILWPNAIQRSLILLILFLVNAGNLSAQPQANNGHDQPEKLIRELYDQVTFPEREEPDWEYVRTLFIKDATIAMRTGPEVTSILDLNGWILDFVNFIYKQNIRETGFEEKIIEMETMVFGNIAHVLVLYTSFIPGVSKEPREGVDSFHCIKENDSWKIVSILNEIPGPNRPKPAVLK